MSFRLVLIRFPVLKKRLLSSVVPSITTTNTRIVPEQIVATTLNPISTTGSVSSEIVNSELANRVSTGITLSELESLNMIDFSPVGFVLSILENIRMITGLPWWATFLVWGVTLRTLTFPLTILLYKNRIEEAKYAHVYANMRKAIESTKTIISRAQAMRALDREKTKNGHLTETKKMLYTIGYPVVAMANFIAVRDLCNPLITSMTREGMFGIDLTLPDVLLLSPIIYATVSYYEQKARAKEMGSELKWWSKYVPLLTMPLYCQLPMGTICFFVFTRATSLCLSLLLTTDSARSLLNLSKLPKKSYLYRGGGSWFRKSVTIIPVKLKK